MIRDIPNRLVIPLPGIGAFIAYGLLCTLLDWVAPVPPRRAATSGART